MPRRYHDAIEGWQPVLDTTLTWFDGRTGTGGPGELICHGDPGPWNLVWRKGRLVGLIDWDYATVGTRRDDVAYALHYLVPFRDRSYWQGVLASQRAGLDRISRLAELGHPRYRQLIDDGGLEREQRAVRWGERLRRRFDLPGQDLAVTPPPG